VPACGPTRRGLRWRSVRMPLRHRPAYDWLEAHDLSYAIGFGSNVRLKKLAAPVARAQRRFERTGQNVRMFSSLRYRGRRWRPVGEC